MTLHAYIPQDRLRALSRGKTLPDRTSGAALFADISGFTPLTEALRDSLGSRQGAEELTKHLDTVYTSLISEVEKYGSSVLGFAGDAITCWFESDKDELGRILAPHASAGVKDEIKNSSFILHPSSFRAVSCAFALQIAMEAFKVITLPDGKTTSLSLKVSVATGSARRFVVGDPDIHYIDALAGATVARTSTAEHLANKGEILVDEATVNALGDALTIKEWRNAEGGENFGVAEKLSVISEQLSAHQNTDDRSLITLEQLKQWIHSVVYNREQSGQGAFLTEFRPCAVLFINFAGIDYEADDAQAQLDTFIRQLQKISARYEGAVLQLTIGDKGSYAYINFGALISHEDDARRAVKAALEIRNQTELQLRIGVTQGVMRVGAYGGVTRRTYGALGDEVNLAARLMTNAAAGEILLSGQIQKTTAQGFISEPRPALKLKGKAEPVTVFAVTGERKQRAVRLQEPQYSLPMVGREQELEIINDKLDLTLQGKSQVIGVVAEAGMGKSRLVAEVIRAARKKGFAGYGGACQSDAIHTPYQAWKSVWQAFFNVDHEVPLKKQMRLLEGEIEDRAPERVEAMPLLNVVLDLEIPDNDFTKGLEPKYRQSALRALLEDCLRAAADVRALHATPLLIVIEDLHWIDALSHDLLEEFARDLSDSRVCFVLAYRPLFANAPRLEALAQFSKIELHELNPAEAEQAIRAKLAQLYPARSGALPIGLVDKLMARSQGNPFYLEELLNYVRDRGLDPADLSKIELPDSLHTLILSRIDQLSEREKITLRVASIVGRLFRAEWLTGYYPELGAPAQVKAALNALESLDITPLDSPEPELAYLFKHIVTHEVTYESLPFATRAKLHEQLAKYLESIVGATRESPLLDTIAFHYGRSDNTAKQREYFQKAGDAAQAAYANEAALDYFAKLLPLLTDLNEQIEIHLKRAEILARIGKWAEAEADYQIVLTLAEQTHNTRARVRSQKDLVKLKFLQSNLPAAREWAEQAVAGAEALADPTLQAQCALELAGAENMLGEHNRAQARLEMALPLARKANDIKTVARILIFLAGLAVYRRSDYEAAGVLIDESLTLARQLADKSLLAGILGSYAAYLTAQGKYSAAQIVYIEQLALARETGDKAYEAVAFIDAGFVAICQGRLAQGRNFYEQALPISRATNFKGQLIYISDNLAEIYFEQGDYTTAQRLWKEAAALARELDYKDGIGFTAHNLGMFALATGQLTAAEAHFAEALQIYQALDSREGISRLNANWAMLAAMQGQAAKAQQLGVEALAKMRLRSNLINTAYVLVKIGFVDLHHLEYVEAQAHYLEAIRIYAPGEHRGYDWVEAWAGLACAYIHQPEKIERGVQLAAVTEKILHDMGAVLYPILRAPFDEALALAKERLGEAAFQSAWEEGGEVVVGGGG